MTQARLWLGNFSSAGIFLLFSGTVVLAIHKAMMLLGYPAPFTYGEGVMTWMTWRMGNWMWPYGDILGMPSVYSCYGPLPSFLALILSKAVFLPESIPPGGELFFAGKVITFFSWVTVAVCIFSIRQAKLWQRALAASVPFGMFAGTVFMYSWRIDPFLCAVFAGVLLYYSMHPSRPRLAIGASFALAVALTKPTSLIEFPMFIAMGVMLGGGAVRAVANHIAKSVGMGVVVLVVCNFLSGGWMLENILSIQMLSGWKDMEGVFYGLRALGRQPMSPLIFGLLVVSFFREGRGVAAVLWMAVLFALATHTKEGGAENYYMPLTVLIGPVIARTAGVLPSFKNFLVCWALVFILMGGFDRMTLRWSGWGGFLKTSRVENAVRLFDDKEILSEDALFPVLANKEPLVSDLYQLIAVQSRKGGDLDAWVKRASGGVLGGGRIFHACGEQKMTVELKMGGGEWYSYYPDFQCRWTPSRTRTSPFPTAAYIFLAMIGVGGLRLAMRRSMA